MELRNKKILVIDDDPHLCDMISLVFSHEGAKVYSALNGKEGLKLFYAEQPDIVILDVRMPEMDGWETCQQIRLLADTPIIMLTTMADDQNIIKGLTYGADDFLAKPFNSDVLMARVIAVLRRVSTGDGSSSKPRTYKDNRLTIDLNERRVLLDGEPVKLSATEFKLLSFLLTNANRVLSYQQILTNVWGPEYRDNIDYVHVYMSHLRQKLEANPREPVYFQTEHGIGYRVHFPAH